MFKPWQIVLLGALAMIGVGTCGAFLGWIISQLHDCAVKHLANGDGAV